MAKNSERENQSRAKRNNRRASTKRQRQEAKELCRPFADQVFGHRFDQLFRDLVHEAQGRFHQVMLVRLQHQCILLNIDHEAQWWEQLAERIEAAEEAGFRLVQEIQTEVRLHVFAEVKALLDSVED